MKNTDKDTFAEEILSLLKEKGLNRVDSRKAISRAYRKITDEIQSGVQDADTPKSSVE